MQISVISVGKIREKYVTQGMEEYARRLSRYCRLVMIEAPDEKAPESLSKAEEDQVRQVEGQRILSHIKPRQHVIALDRAGQSLTSQQFSRSIQHLALKGDSHLAFVIGGSLGLSPSVLKRADQVVSFSKMTFPHQLIRLFLLEQLYRAFKIMRGEPYHK